MITVIGVRFRTAGKIYYFDPAGRQIKTGDHVFRVGFEREYMAGLEVPELLALLEMLLTATRDVKHDGGVLFDLARGDGIDERSQCDTAAE